MTAVVPLVVTGSLVGGVLGVGLAGVAWRHREVPAALPFGGLMLAIAAWSFGNAAFLTVESTTAVYVAHRVIWAAGAQVPPLWLVFVLAYAGREEWITARNVAALWLYPLTYVLLLVTAPIHEWTSTPADVSVLTTGGITAPHIPPDLLFNAHLLLAYVTIGLGYVVLLTFLVRARAVYRKQTAIVVGGTMVPVFANVVFNFQWLPHPGIDVTPIAFIVMGLAIGWALVTYDFLTVTPMAEDVLIDELPDPVFVLDEDDRIVDYNPAAVAAFGHDDPADEPLDAVAPGLAEDVEGGAIFCHRDQRLADGGVATYYEPTVTTLEDQYGTARSALVVLREVTGQQRRQDRLEALQEATRQFLAASTDDQIADIAVGYAEETLDCEAAGVFLADGDGALVATATTEAATELFDPDELVVEPEDGWAAYEAYESGEAVDLHLDHDTGGPIEQLLFLPLGEFGILAVGTVDATGFDDGDEGFATILARTTQVALARAERESELRQNRRALEHRTEQIAFFNGVLRHSLRNSLLVIEGRAEHLREHLPASEQEHVDTIARWCGDLDELSEEIRSVNDTVTASESERLETVNLSALLRGKTPEYRRRHPEATVELDVEDGIEILANDLAEAVIDAIVDNAVVHNDGDAPHVAIWTRRAADRVQLHVADDGPGMTDEMKSIVFERSVSTNQTASGFGLHFVSVLMNLYGGNLRFEDNDPEGTVAVLEFQLVDGDSD